MIQIGFCDDDPSVLDELHELLGSYRTEHNADIAPTAFQSPFELLASIERAHALIFCCSGRVFLSAQADLAGELLPADGFGHCRLLAREQRQPDPALQNRHHTR